MNFKYQIYAYYRHRPKFIKQFDNSDEADKFKAEFTKQEQNVEGFEFCYTEVVAR